MRLLVLLALLLGACGGAGEGSRPPSFVIVLADDLGWADVGFQGSTFHRTPNLDRLAADGLAFSQGYAPSPVCTPSRAGLLTGCSPARLHLTSVFGVNTPFEDLEARLDEAEEGDLVQPTVLDGLPPEVPTVARRLAEAGYATGLIGKWHLHPEPEEVGFGVELGARGLLRSYFSPYGLDSLSDGPPGEYLTDRLTDEAIAFLEAHRDGPFLLVLSHYAPHLPLQAPVELVAEYARRADPAAPQHNPVYAAMIERVDVGLGRLCEALERLGLAESTLLVFTSDNGAFEERRAGRRHSAAEDLEITSNLPLRSGKGRVYEGGLRVPLVAWGGPVRARGRCDVPVVLTDLAPTLLALAGAKPLAVSDGVDLSGLLRGTGVPDRSALFFHFPHQSFASAVRDGDEKLIWSWAREEAELYDLASDPGERHDLAAERPERVRVLRDELFTWLDAVGADRPVRR